MLINVKWGPDTIKLLLTLFVVTIKTCKPTLPNELYKAVQKAAIEVTVTQTLWTFDTENGRERTEAHE